MSAGHLYEFGRFRLDTEGRLLSSGSERIPLTPKAVDVLVALLEKRGAPVARKELLTIVWSDATVEEGTLSSHISLLRKALGASYIETIPKRGYRFAGPVHERARETADETSTRLLLAVLPFENLSGSRKYDSFSDGLTEEMITQLGRLNPKRLGVIARTSSMTYKSTDKTIEQIGNELDVSHVLEGSVRRTGGRVRITAQLIQVSDQTHVWADSYDASLENILALQSRIARAVAKEIQIKLVIGEETRLVVPAAYEACLKARYLWNRRSEDGLQASVRLFQDAIDADPEYAPAYAGMADAYLAQMDHGYLSPREGFSKASRVLSRALELDDELAEAHVSLAHAAFHEFDWTTADREFCRGIDMNPSYAIGRHYYSNFLAAMDRSVEAIEEAEQARQLDPVSSASQSNLASILWLARRYDRALTEARRVLDMDPLSAAGYGDLGRAHEQLGAFDAAIDAFRKAVSFSGQSHGHLASLGHTYAVAGRREEAAGVLRQLEEMARERFVSAYSFAVLQIALGAYDDAFRSLERAYEERSSPLPFVGVNPRFDPVRTDPRFKVLLSRLHL